ncbi:MAG TPA: VWA domain-containing protein [Acidimicrobiales bacterium]|jgi:hypothetical protein|nr:VWA domain-containing protein [Acidimicrobiales bacterium]
MTEFRIECYQNEFLPRHGQVMNAVVTVTGTGTGSAGAMAMATDTERSELFIVDASGSMSGKKLRAAKQATSAAIDCVPDGVRFGVIAGNHRAALMFPGYRGGRPDLAVSSPQNRTSAKTVVKGLSAGGGTAMGAWITLAAETFGDAPGIRHAILLTDGKNETESPDELDAALLAVEGAFQCDCRGVGADWAVAELRKVATALMGTYDIVAKPEGLEDDFSSMMRAALSKRVSVGLRIWTPKLADVVLLKQMEPQLDLTSTRVDVDPLVGEYATGSWGDESRDYFLSVQVPAKEVDEEMLAARITLVVGGQPGEQGLVKAIWTDDVAKSTQMNRRVAQAMNEEELADVIQEVVDSFRAGDLDSATNRAGRAVRMAHEAGNEDVLERLSKMFEVDDRATGRVRPRRNVDDVDVMIIETKSTRTSRTAKPAPEDP